MNYTSVHVYRIEHRSGNSKSMFVSALFRQRVATVAKVCEDALVPVAAIVAYVALKKQKRDNAKSGVGLSGGMDAMGEGKRD